MLPETKNPSRRQFLQSTLTSAAATALISRGASPVSTPSTPTPFTPSPFELEEITILQLHSALQSKKFTSHSLTEKYLARIHEIDSSGPQLNSVIELNPDALSIAAALDAEQSSKGLRGPLHGIPVLIKDNLGTADKMSTTCGSLALLNFTPPKDSAVAARLRAAGAVILGKTNLSEWANCRSSHSSSGWSGRGGQTHNPYALDRNPCGSSSGSGAATSANLCAASIGTETNGSIVCPSNANGLVGIKPTLGLVSRAGIIPVAHSQDTAGPICRTVADCAAILSAIAAVDSDDPATQVSERKSHDDYTQFLDRSGLRGARIGVLRDTFNISEPAAPLCAAALDVMKHEGATLIDIEIPSAAKLDESENEVLLYELKNDLNAYLAANHAPIRTLKEIIAFNENNREKELLYFGQDLFTQAESRGPLTDKKYLDALEKNHRLTRTEGIDAVMDQHHLDAIVALTGGPAWLTDLVDGDHFGGASSSLAAIAGYPNINVPAGYIFGLPIGLSFFGRAWSEPTLIKICFAFEQSTLHRRPPSLLPSANLSTT
jgi:amidase